MQLHAYLIELRGKLSQEALARVLEPHGGPGTKQAISQVERGDRAFNSAYQLAYVRGLGLSDPEALKLQRLAGQWTATRLEERRPSRAKAGGAPPREREDAAAELAS